MGPTSCKKCESFTLPQHLENIHCITQMITSMLLKISDIGCIHFSSPGALGGWGFQFRTNRLIYKVHTSPTRCHSQAKTNAPNEQKILMQKSMKASHLCEWVRVCGGGRSCERQRCSARRCVVWSWETGRPLRRPTSVRVSDTMKGQNNAIVLLRQSIKNVLCEGVDMTTAKVNCCATFW